MIKFVQNILLLFVLLSCSTPQRYQSSWHEKNSNTPAAFFHKNNKLTLAVSNDNQFLYLEIVSYAPETIQKIKQLGLSLWLSKGATPNKTYGIHYPLPFDNTQGEVALEGFNQQGLAAMSLAAIAPIELQASFLPEAMHYQLKLPLSELQFTTQTVFTVNIASFSLGKQEYLNSLTTAQEIERRLDTYKANPEYLYSKSELVPFFKSFRLAKMPNKNP